MRRGRVQAGVLSLARLLSVPEWVTKASTVDRDLRNRLVWAVRRTREELCRHAGWVTDEGGLGEYLRYNAPQLFPPMDELDREHQGISLCLSELEAYVAGLDGPDPTGPARVSQCAYRLESLMNAHASSVSAVADYAGFA